MIVDALPEELSEVEMWGLPWHGLIAGNTLTLPNDLTKTVGAWWGTYAVDRRGDTILFQIPGIPPVTLPDDGIALGMRLDNYALLSGSGHLLGIKSEAGGAALFLGPMAWLYLDPGGIRWLISLGLEGTVTPITDETIAVTTPGMYATSKRINMSIAPVVTDITGAVIYSEGVDYLASMLGIEVIAGGSITPGNLLVDFTPIEWVDLGSIDHEIIAAYDPIDLYLRAERFGEFGTPYEAYYFHVTMEDPGTLYAPCASTAYGATVALRFEDANTTGTEILLAPVFSGSAPPRWEEAFNVVRIPLAFWKLSMSGSGVSLAGALTVACSATDLHGTIVEGTDPRGHQNIVVGMWFNNGVVKKILLDVLISTSNVDPSTPAGLRLLYRIHEEGRDDYSQAWVVRTSTGWTSEGDYVTSYFEDPAQPHADGDCSWERNGDNGFEILHSDPFVVNCSFHFGGRKHVDNSMLHGDSFYVVRYANNLYGVCHEFFTVAGDGGGIPTGDYSVISRGMPMIYPGGITLTTDVAEPFAWAGPAAGSHGKTRWASYHPVTGQISRSALGSLNTSGLERMWV